MNKCYKFLSILFVTILLLNIIMPTVYAITDKYQFTSNENSNIQLEDEFIYRDDCFKRSSFLGCSHLEILSSQAAIASSSWYGENIDKYEVDFTQNAHNIVEMLKNMGFEDVSTNKYYTLEKQENSAGVAVGHKTLQVDGKEYTLLAIMPRSACYKQEWAGNFTVGDGSIHEGFKAARDEILRYVNKYIKDNNIQGDLKVWIAGHSRGAAVSNMLGGFFAGGGIEYFGTTVSITPEDVYCYTYATPRTIKNGTNKNIELSVSANREAANYANDTPGESFSYTKGGQVNVEDEVYGGIRNFVSPNDIFPLLPPEEWGFTYYGTKIASNHGIVTEESMLEELKEISPYAYSLYMNGGDPNSFERKTFDLKTLSIVKDEGNYSAMNMSTFLQERMHGLIYKANTNSLYKSESYQDALKSVAGIYGMSMTLFDEDFVIDYDELISPLAFAYLSYASERLQAEGRATNETKAISIALAELIAYYTGENIDIDTATVDDVVVILAKFVAENENEPVVDMLISKIVEIVPEDYQGILAAFKSFHKDENSTIEEGLKAFLKACYNGPDPECSLYDSYENGEQVRSALYVMLYVAMSSDYPVIAQLVAGNTFQFDASGELTSLVEAILSMVKTVKDDEGNIIKTYTNFAELADDKLTLAVDSIFIEILAKAQNIFGEDYKNKLNEHIENAKLNVSKIREAALYALFYDDEPYSIEKDIKNITTFIGNAEIIPLAHYNEINIAYAKASQNYDCGYEEHEIEYNCIEGENQIANITEEDVLTFRFDIEYETFLREGKVFIDNNEVPRDKYTISKGSTIITFINEYTKSLGVGQHTIQASTDEGSVKVAFEIAKSTIEDTTNTQNTENPKTGDNITIFVSLMIISSLGVILVKRSYRK